MSPLSNPTAIIIYILLCSPVKSALYQLLITMDHYVKYSSLTMIVILHPQILNNICHIPPPSNPVKSAHDQMILTARLRLSTRLTRSMRIWVNPRHKIMMIWQRILQAATIYCCLLSTENGFPELALETELVKLAWEDAYKKSGMPTLALTPDITEIVSHFL